MSKPVTLTPEQRIAACVFFGLACLAWRGRTDSTWWYRWCVEHSGRARDPLTSALWWCIRTAERESDEGEESAAEWLAYVEHVLTYRARGPR